jgi:hypothetical protein
MSVPENLARLCSDWTGSNRLWLDPRQPADVSTGTASVELAAQGQFLTLRYTWTVDGQPQDGLLVIGCALDSNQVAASWIDSWHMAHQMMSAAAAWGRMARWLCWAPMAPRPGRIGVGGSCSTRASRTSCA